MSGLYASAAYNVKYPTKQSGSLFLDADCLFVSGGCMLSLYTGQCMHFSALIKRAKGWRASHQYVAMLYMQELA